MKITVTLLAVMIGLLSIAAGAAKIVLVPDEAEFLRQFGFTNAHTISYGLVQAISGLMLVIPVTRLYGALLVAAGFTLSAILILVAGNLVFAGVSLVPVMLAAFVAYHSFRGRPSS